MFESGAKLFYGPLDDEPSKDTDDFLIFSIPGNPGLISYYEPFLATLQTLLSSASSLHSARFYTCGHSLSGFSTSNERLDRSTQLVGLAGQIKHVDDLLYREVKRLRKTTGRSPKVILMGHSVGAYILLEIVRNHRERIQSVHSPEEDFDLIGGILLFPTITDIAQSPSGSYASVCNEQ